MRAIKFVVPFMLALFIASAQGADKGAKPMHGDLAAPPTGAAAGVVGVLTVKGHAKEKGGEAPAPKTYNLVADGETAKQVTALIGKNVDVTGEGTEASYKVATVAEHVAKNKPK